MRKINLALAVAIVAIVALNIQAQKVSGSVELETTVKHGEVTPQLNVYAEGPLKGKLGWSVWSLTSKSWSEAYGGLTYSPRKWVTVSGSIGLETDKNPGRIAGSVYVSKGKWSGLHIDEYGGSGYWYKTLIKYQVRKTTAVGMYDNRFDGIGPYAEKSFGKLTVWGAYTHKNRAHLAIRFNF